jgi:putative two-component system response regulator
VRNAGKILIADDVAANRDLLAGLLTREGYTVRTAADGAEAMLMIRDELPDLILSDVLMPKMNGFELCRHLKSERATRLIPVVIVTSLAEREDRIEGINAGADDFLSKPVDAHELKARVRSLVRLKRFTDDLDTAESVILSLALTVEARDSYTSGHCQRMASYAAAFGVQIGLPDEDVAALHRGGYMHDVGKVGVADAILLKPGRLTPDEYEAMQRHTIIGEALCGQLRLLKAVRPIVRHHHERYDGSGYPDGLAGDQIPALAQIMGIVDVYDALTTDRIYRPSLSEEAAIAELRNEASRGWHRTELVQQFTELWTAGRLKNLREGAPGPVPLGGFVR